jgi:hypothetical protein
MQDKRAPVPATVDWIPLADIYHDVLERSPSPEAAKIEIATARKNGQLPLFAEQREHKAEPNVQLPSGQKPPHPEPETVSDCPVPSDGFNHWDWERGRATRRDGKTKSLVEYVNIRGRRDDVLRLSIRRGSPTGAEKDHRGAPSRRRPGPRPRDDWPTWFGAELIRVVCERGGKPPANVSRTAKDLCTLYSQSRDDGWAPEESAARKLIGELLRPARGIYP